MEHLQFTHAIARIRVLETKLLDKAKIDRMIDSSSSEDALKIIQRLNIQTIWLI